MAEISDRVWDMAIVGAGSAGMMAAYFAAQRGVSVLLLEAAPVLGGTMWVSTGQMSAAGTRLQKMRGIEDSADQHYADVMRISRGTAKPEIVRLAVDNAAETFDWLMDQGLEVEPDHPVSGFGHEHYSRARYYWNSQGGLALHNVLNPLIEGEEAAGRLVVAREHRVTALVTDGTGAVTGLTGTRADGTEFEIASRKALIASGGYAADQKLFAEYGGQPQYTQLPYAFSQGAALSLGQAVGAEVVGRDHFFIGFGTLLDSDEIPAPVSIRAETYPERRQPWEIYVNAHGHRFVREDIGSVDAREHALMAQPDRRFWIIFDDAMLNAAPPVIAGWSVEEIRAAFAADRYSFTHGDTIEDLARVTGIDAEGLRHTIDGYNYGVQTGNDFFGRAHLPQAFGGGPYYAIRQQGGAITSAAGLSVNAKLEVLRPDGSAIAGLYAAGEAIGASQTMGEAACGGMMVTPALTFGRLFGAGLISV